MANLLEQYHEYRNSFNESLLTAMPDPASVWRHQELLYRIEALEVCQMFAGIAPQSSEPEDLYWHYQMVDAYFRTLKDERRFGLDTGEEVKKQRETAHSNLQQLIQDYQIRFQSFAPGNDADYYRKTIINTIQTVIAVWIQYRQTFVEIVTKEAV